MSELKAYKMVNEKYCTDCVCVIPADVYFKSEADKVIAHHKHKRCLAMAERCNDKIDNPVERDEHDGWLIITEYWERWYKRWLELAEKFKEA